MRRFSTITLLLVATLFTVAKADPILGPWFDFVGDKTTWEASYDPHQMNQPHVNIAVLAAYEFEYQCELALVYANDDWNQVPYQATLQPVYESLRDSGLSSNVQGSLDKMDDGAQGADTCDSQANLLYNYHYTVINGVVIWDDRASFLQDDLDDWRTDYLNPGNAALTEYDTGWAETVVIGNDIITYDLVDLAETAVDELTSGYGGGGY